MSTLGMRCPGGKAAMLDESGNGPHGELQQTALHVVCRWTGACLACILALIQNTQPRQPGVVANSFTANKRTGPSVSPMGSV